MAAPSTAGAETEFTVFISSPSDVEGERDRAKVVLDQLNTELAGRFRFNPISWPDTYYTAKTGFQPQIKKPSSCDIVICVLWSKLGSELPASFNRPDGTSRTGTEYEFEEALEFALQNETPDILVYKKMQEEISLKTTQVADQSLQLKALEAFWGRWFRDEKGHFTAGFDTFESSKDFGDKLKRHLRQWLERRVKRTTWSIAIKGSPYRRLESFDPSHAEVFFGRRRAIRQVIARLQTRALDGCAFLVVVGMSGAGKSSMVKAGVVPWLTKAFIPSDVDEWRHCILRCDLILDDPALSVARALSDADCLPELGEGDYGEPETFAKLIREAPSSAAAPIAAALRRAGEAMRGKKKLDHVAKVQLVVVFDQLEALLLGPAASRDLLVPLMDAMARSGAIAVIATLRSDYYPEFQANPGLMALKTDGASFDLAPPNVLEINEIIEWPARAAGLGLQQDGEQDLAALLNKAAAKPGSLPLLEFTLASLFDGRDQKSDTLLLKTYEELGGLEGAIAVEAERLVSALPAPLQAALPDLLLALVEVDETKGGASASARTLPRAMLKDPDQIELADHLIAGRFLVADDAGGGPTLRLAHEALLQHWPRLSALIAAESDFLGSRRRLQREALVWERETRHDDFLLPHGRRLTEAADLLANRGAHLEAETVAFIKASQIAATAKLAAERKHNRQRRLILAGAVLAAIVLAVMAGLIIVDQQRAEAVAVANDKADQLIDAGRFSEIIPLAAAALPATIDDASSPAEHELAAKLQYAIDRNRLRLAIAGFDHKPSKIMFDRSGTRILAASNSGELGVWDATTGAVLLAYQNRNLGCCATFDPSGRYLIVADPQGRVQVRDLKSWALVRSLSGAGGPISTLSIDPSGEVLVSGARDGRVRLWAARTFAPRADTATGGGAVNAVAYCAAQRWFASFSGDGQARRWDYDGKPGAAVAIKAAGLSRGVISANCATVAAVSDRRLWLWNPANPSSPRQIEAEQPINSIAIDPSGDRIVTASSDGESADLWDAATGALVTDLPSPGRVQAVAFGPNDGRIVTAAFNDWVALWDGQTGRSLPGNLVLRDGAAFNRQVVFSPNGDRVATVADVQKPSEPAVRIWDVQPRPAVSAGTGIGTIAVGSPVRRVVFSPDRRWIATASADGLVRLWDAQTLGAATDMNFIHLDGPVYDLAFAPGMAVLATASGDGSADLWSLAARKLDRSLPVPPPVGGRAPWATYVAFDPKATRVVAAFTDSDSASGEALVSNAASGGLLRPLAPGGRETWSAVFDASGQLILTASENHTATIWDAATGKLRWTLAGHAKALNWAGFSHRGDKAVTVSDDATARLWDVASGKPIGGPLVNDPAGMVQMAAFSPDDAELVTSTSTGRLYYWRVADGKLLGIRMMGLNDQIIYGLDFDPNGQRIAVASHDGTVQVIDAHIDPTASLKAARDIANRIRPKGD
ncbi:MAG TPA: hypothetical protein VGL73_00480 [Caulobacteraceae bacterium]